MENDKTDYRGIEFLAAKTERLLEKQKADYWQKHVNAGILLGVIAVFVPFFLDRMQDAESIVFCLVMSTILIFIAASICLFLVLVKKTLGVSIKPEKLKELADQPYKKILETEISANTGMYVNNNQKLKNNNLIYNIGVALTISAIILSISLLVANIMLPEKEKTPANVELIN